MSCFSPQVPKSEVMTSERQS